MVSFRFLVACVVMVLVPLQGFAAASRLCCALAPAHRVAMHGGAHTPRAAAPSAARAAHASHEQAPATASSSEDAERCLVCASLCHAVGVPQAVAVALLPQVLHEHGSLLTAAILDRPFPVADKPPRG